VSAWFKAAGADCVLLLVMKSATRSSCQPDELHCQPLLQTQAGYFAAQQEVQEVQSRA
jgi:hypothetical protein